MPEIKRNFIKGKMNKDLDERIVQNGEYRNALNIEVATSDGSDVGTIQNIKGNTRRSNTNDMYCGTGSNCYWEDIHGAFSGLTYDAKGCTTVGTVANSSKDTILWLQTGCLKAYNITSTNPKEYQILEFDRIIEYNPSSLITTPVFVDNFRTRTRTHLTDHTPNSSNIISTATLGFTPQGIRPGMTVQLFSGAGDDLWRNPAAAFASTFIHEDVVVTVKSVNVASNQIELEVTNHFDGAAWTEDTWSGGIAIPNQSNLIFEADRVLNFDKDRLITGINIIDDILFFTDNHSEPKKIHIERSKLGTIDLNTHTNLYSNGILNDGTLGNDLIPVREEHVTVIKKSPLFPLSLKISNTIRGDGSSIVNTISNYHPIYSPNAISAAAGPISSCDTYAGGFDLTAYDSGFMYDPVTLSPYFIDDDPITPLPETTILVPNAPLDANGDLILDWLPGDKLILKATSVSQGIAKTHEVHAVITPTGAPNATTTASYSTTTDAHECYVYQENLVEVGIQFTSISSDIPMDKDDIISWDIKLDQAKESMFKFKFPRFAYRWKYEDGEYSTFSPFTETAFVPSKFDYMPRKGFNLGMTNDIRMLYLTDFVNSETPEDVVEIDLLYKESNSPNIYTVKTLKREKAINATVTPNDLDWDQNLYSIESDLIYASIESNQLNRPWDAVPRKALGQEITANRLVFANYLQNYDLVRDNDLLVVPNFSMSVSDVVYNNPDLPKYSIDNTPDARMPERSVKSLRTYQIGIVYKDKYGRETPVITNPNNANIMSLYIEKDKAQRYNQIVVNKTLSEPLQHPEWAESFKFFIKETSNEYYNLAMDRWYPAEDGNVWLSFPSSDRNKVDLETFLILKKQHDNDNYVTDRARYKILAIEGIAPEFITKKDFSFGNVVTTFSATGLPLTDSTYIDVDYNSFTSTGLNGTVFPTKQPNLKLRISSSNKKSFWYKITDITEIGSIARISVEKSFDVDMDFTDNGSGGVISGLSLEIVQERKERTKEFQGRFFIKIHKDVDLETNVLHQTDVQDFIVTDTLRYTALSVSELDYSPTLGHSADQIYGYDSVSGTIQASQYPYKLMSTAGTPAAGEWGHKNYLDPLDVQLVKQFWNGTRGGYLANVNSLAFTEPATSADGSTGSGFVHGDAWKRFSWFIDSQWGENPIRNGISYLAEKTYNWGEDFLISEIGAYDMFARIGQIPRGTPIDLTDINKVHQPGFVGAFFSLFDNWNDNTKMHGFEFQFDNIKHNTHPGFIDNNDDIHIFGLGESRIIAPKTNQQSQIWHNINRNAPKNAWNGFTNPNLNPSPGNLPRHVMDSSQWSTNAGKLHDGAVIQDFASMDSHNNFLSGKYETVEKDDYIEHAGINAHKFTAQHDDTIVRINAQFQVRPALDCDPDHPTDPWGKVEKFELDAISMAGINPPVGMSTFLFSDLSAHRQISPTHYGGYKELHIKVPNPIRGQSAVGGIADPTFMSSSTGIVANPPTYPETQGGECPGCMHTGNTSNTTPKSMSELVGYPMVGGLTGLNVKLKLYHTNTSFSGQISSGTAIDDQTTGFVPEHLGNATSFGDLRATANMVPDQHQYAVMSRGDHFYAKNDYHLQIVLVADQEIKLNKGESVWLEIESYEKEYDYKHYISQWHFYKIYEYLRDGTLTVDEVNNVLEINWNTNIDTSSPALTNGPTQQNAYDAADPYIRQRGMYGGPIEICRGNEVRGPHHLVAKDAKNPGEWAEDFTETLVTTQMAANSSDQPDYLHDISHPVWGNATHPNKQNAWYFDEFIGTTASFSNALRHDTFLTKDRDSRLWGGIALPAGFGTSVNQTITTTQNADIDDLDTNTVLFTNAAGVFGLLNLKLYYGATATLSGITSNASNGWLQDSPFNKPSVAIPTVRVPENILTYLSLNPYHKDSTALFNENAYGQSNVYNGVASAMSTLTASAPWDDYGHSHPVYKTLPGSSSFSANDIKYLYGVQSKYVNKPEDGFVFQAVSSGNFLNYSFQWEPEDKTYKYGYPLLFPFHKFGNNATYDYDPSAYANIGNWNTSNTKHDDIEGWVGTRIGEDTATLCAYCNHTYNAKTFTNVLLNGDPIYYASTSYLTNHSNSQYTALYGIDLANATDVVTVMGPLGVSIIDGTYIGWNVVEYWDGGINPTGGMFQNDTTISFVTNPYTCNGGANTCRDIVLDKFPIISSAWALDTYGSNIFGSTNPRFNCINSTADVLLHPTPWVDDLRGVYYPPTDEGKITNVNSWYTDCYHNISSAIPNVTSARDFSGYGLHNQGKRLHLSFSGINNTLENWKKSAYNLSQWHPELASNLWNLKSVGTMFRFANDPNGAIFKITSSINSYDHTTNGIGIRNYMPAYTNTSGEDWDHPSFNATHDIDDVRDPYNKRVRFYLDIEYTGWNTNYGMVNGILSTSATGDYVHNPNADTTHMGIGHLENLSQDAANFPELIHNPVLGTSTDPVSTNQFPYTDNTAHQGERYATIEFIAPDWDGSEDFTSANPAIFETEPKEDLDLDIYYEASPSYPTRLNSYNAENYFKGYQTAPLVPHVVVTDPAGGISSHIVLDTVEMQNGDINGDVLLTCTGTNGVLPTIPSTTISLTTIPVLRFTTQDGNYVEAKVKKYYYDGNSDWLGTLTVEPDSPIHEDTKFGLPYFNCYSFGNGVESDRIRDDFNAVRIGKGVKVSTTLGEQYREERRKNSFIFSGIYNSNSGINRLNQFISIEDITKEINPTYGSIQKLHSRNTDLIALCENKVLRVLANKDALYNADGDFRLTSTKNVLGQAVPYAGEYGIGKYPESFASYGYRAYFVDQERGSVLRLSKDGIEVISDYGMKDWFRDNLNSQSYTQEKIIGTYDEHANNYDVTLHRDDGVNNLALSFNEKTNGWVSFKSYIQNLGISFEGKYFTFKHGEIFEHYSNTNRNNFYRDWDTLNQIHHETSFNLLFNEDPAAVKSFNTLNYEGSVAKITATAPWGDGIVDGVSYASHDGSKPPSMVGEYYDNEPIEGWYVNLITTNLQTGRTIEFKNKEGKYFAPIKGEATVWQPGGSRPGNVDTNEFSVQGIGQAMDIVDSDDPTTSPTQEYSLSISASCWSSTVYGCMDPAAFNYNPNATIDDGDCCYDSGCCNPAATNNCTNCCHCNNSLCVGLVPGCMDNPATSITQQITQGTWNGNYGPFNYNASANYDPVTPNPPGSCCYYEGCTDPIAINYDPNACVDDGSCVTLILGCTDSGTTSYWQAVTGPSWTNAFSSYPPPYRPNWYTGPAVNYYPGANIDDGSNPCCYVAACGDATPGDNPDLHGHGSNAVYDLLTDCTGDPDVAGNCTPGTPDACIYPCATGYYVENHNPLTCYNNQSSCVVTTGCTDSTAVNYNPSATQDDGTCCSVEGCINDTQGPWPNYIGLCRDGVAPTTVSQCDYSCDIDDGTGIQTYNKCGWSTYHTYNPSACANTSTVSGTHNINYDIDYNIYNSAGSIISTATSTITNDQAITTGNLWCHATTTGCFDWEEGFNPNIDGYCNDGTYTTNSTDPTQGGATCVAAACGGSGSGLGDCDAGFVSTGTHNGVPIGFKYENINLPNWCRDTDNIDFPYGQGLPNTGMDAFKTAYNQCPGHKAPDTACIATGTCICTIGGCMDPLATNYDPTVTYDNGACTYIPTTLCPVTQNYLYPDVVNSTGEWLTPGNSSTWTYGGSTYSQSQLTQVGNFIFEKVLDDICISTGSLDPNSYISVHPTGDTCTDCIYQSNITDQTLVQIEYCQSWNTTALSAWNNWNFTAPTLNCDTWGNIQSLIDWEGKAINDTNPNEISIPWPHVTDNNFHSNYMVEYTKIMSLVGLEDVLKIEKLNLDGHSITEFNWRNNIWLKDLSLANNNLANTVGSYNIGDALKNLNFATNLERLNIGNTFYVNTNLGASNSLLSWDIVTGQYNAVKDVDEPVGINTVSGAYYFMWDGEPGYYPQGLENNSGFTGHAHGYEWNNSVSVKEISDILSTPGDYYGTEYMTNLSYLNINHQVDNVYFEEYDSAIVLNPTTIVGSNTPQLIDLTTVDLGIDNILENSEDNIKRSINIASSMVSSIVFNNGFNFGYYPEKDTSNTHIMVANEISKLSFPFEKFESNPNQAASKHLKTLDARYCPLFAHINLQYNRQLEELYVGRGVFDYSPAGGMSNSHSPYLLPTPYMISTTLGNILDAEAWDYNLIGPQATNGVSGAGAPIPFDFKANPSNLKKLVIIGEKVGGSVTTSSLDRKGSGDTTASCHNCNLCTETLNPSPFSAASTYALQSISTCGNPLELSGYTKLEHIDISVWTNGTMGVDDPAGVDAQELRGKSHIYFGRDDVCIQPDEHPSMEFSLHWFNHIDPSADPHSSTTNSIDLQCEIRGLDTTVLKTQGIVPGMRLIDVNLDSDSNGPTFMRDQDNNSGGHDGIYVVSVNETSIKLSRRISTPFETNWAPATATNTANYSSTGVTIENMFGDKNYKCQNGASSTNSNCGLRLYFRGDPPTWSNMTHVSIGGVRQGGASTPLSINHFTGWGNITGSQVIHPANLGHFQTPSDIVLHFGSYKDNTGAVNYRKDDFITASNISTDTDGRINSVGGLSSNYDFKGHYPGEPVSWNTPDNQSISWGIDIFVVD